MSNLYLITTPELLEADPADPWVQHYAQPGPMSLIAEEWVRDNCELTGVQTVYVRNPYSLAAFTFLVRVKRVITYLAKPAGSKIFPPGELPDLQPLPLQ